MLRVSQYTAVIMAEVCVLACVILLAVTVTSWPGAAGALLSRRVLTAEDGPHAVCNDGSPAVYYHSDHTWEGKQNGRFVIHLAGGFFCYELGECIRRCAIDTPELCTTSSKAKIEMGGILSDSTNVNQALSSAYKVYVPYCTSDMFIGDRAASEDTSGYHFRGKRVFTAMVNSLRKNSDLASATEVILSGTSAGGRGVAFNCHHLQSLLPRAQVKCIVDAAILYPFRGPFNDRCADFNTIIRDANEYWHGGVRDFDVDNWWKTFDLPLFIGIQMYDKYGLYYYCGNPTNTAHVQEWGRGMIEIAGKLSAEKPELGLFVPACADHPMIYLDTWYSRVLVGTQALSYGEAVGNWLSQTPPYPVWDTCSHRPGGCSMHCPSAQSPVNHDEL